MEHHDVNLHASDGDGDGDESKVGVDGVTNPSDGVQGGMEEEDGGEGQIWSLQAEHDDDDDLLDVNEASMFYDDFPPLPEFPCMSSSSSSSSIPAPAKPISSSSYSSSASSSSSSSAASWAVLKADAKRYVGETNQHSHGNSQCEAAAAAALSSTASMELVTPSDEGVGDMDCMAVMEDFGYMDLIDTSEIWDPASIFQSESDQQNSTEQEQELEQERERLRQEQAREQCYVLNGNRSEGVLEQGRPLNELGIMFFEWLKSNKEYISVEDMRSIKLRRATVESASKRLGSTREGRKQLLKLILEWVEQYQLQKKRMREEEAAAASAPASQLPYQYQEPFHNPNANPNPNPNLNYASLSPDPTNTGFSPAASPWMPTQQPYVSDPAIIAASSPAFTPAVGFMADPYSNGTSVSPLTQQMNGHPYTPPPEYHMLDSAQAWSSGQIGLASQYNNPFQDGGNLAQAQQHPQALGYGSPYPYQYYHGNGEKLVANLGSSATKEARKKRMARHRRFFSQHRHHNHQNQHQNQTADQHARLGSDSCTNTVQASHGSWVYWPSAASPSASTVAMLPPADRQPLQGQNYQRQVSSDRRQVC